MSQNDDMTIVKEQTKQTRAYSITLSLEYLLHRSNGQEVGSFTQFLVYLIGILRIWKLSSASMVGSCMLKRTKTRPYFRWNSKDHFTVCDFGLPIFYHRRASTARGTTWYDSGIFSLGSRQQGCGPGGTCCWMEKMHRERQGREDLQWSILTISTVCASESSSLFFDCVYCFSQRAEERTEQPHYSSLRGYHSTCGRLCSSHRPNESFLACHKCAGPFERRWSFVICVKIE